MNYDENDIDYDDDYDADITPCPANLNDPELENTDTWQPYDNSSGRNLFHCGYEGYLENVEPTPERPQQECFYDDKDDLVDEEHKDASCRGTANQYYGHGLDLDALRHTFIDEGGIWENGADGIANSLEHHWDSLWEDDGEEVLEPEDAESSSDSDTLSDSNSIFDDW